MLVCIVFTLKKKKKTTSNIAKSRIQGLLQCVSSVCSKIFFSCFPITFSLSPISMTHPAPRSFCVISPWHCSPGFPSYLKDPHSPFCLAESSRSPLRHNLNSLHWSFFAHLRPDAFLAPVVQNAHYPHSLGNYQEQYLCLSVCLFSPGPNLKLFVGKGYRSFIFFPLLHGHISVFICQASTQWGAEGTWVNQLRVLTSCNAYLSILLLLFLMWISLFSSYKS